MFDFVRFWASAQRIFYCRRFFIFMIYVCSGVLGSANAQTYYAVWRPSTAVWYVITSTTLNSYPNPTYVQQLGLSGDIPLTGDFDGNGITDYGVWRPSTATWYAIPSNSPGTLIVKQWGLNGDIPVPGDFDGDSITDFAVWRPSTATWWIV